MNKYNEATASPEIKDGQEPFSYCNDCYHHNFINVILNLSNSKFAFD
jgi:hypothetical protein